MKKSLTSLFVLVFLGGFALQAQADVKQVKIYKEAFSTETAPKCIVCHIDKTPKKEDGKHELNDYGMKLIAENPKPDVDTYKKVGEPKADEAATEETK